MHYQYGIRLLRMNAAIKLLIQTDLALDTITESVGYDNARIIFEGILAETRIRLGIYRRRQFTEKDQSTLSYFINPFELKAFPMEVRW